VNEIFGFISDVDGCGYYTVATSENYLANVSVDFVYCPVLEQYFSKVVCEKLCRKRRCPNKK
jgi:hypothetical protein